MKLDSFGAMNNSVGIYKPTVSAQPEGTHTRNPGPCHSVAVGFGAADRGTLTKRLLLLEQRLSLRNSAKVESPRKLVQCLT